MYPLFLSPLLLLLPLLLLGGTSHAAPDHSKDPDLFHFVTRRDLTPPRWNVTIYDRSQLAPGYWFVAPKHSLQPTLGTHAGWTGPHIYDGNGELVWSGANQLDSPNLNDFRVNEVRGQQMLTVYDRDRGAALFLDTHYELHHVHEVVDSIKSKSVNAHELKMVNDGKSFLVMGFDRKKASVAEKLAIGFNTTEKDCWGLYNTFAELDVETGEELFAWNAYGIIGFQENYDVAAGHNIGDRKGKCRDTWDFMHANSVDKTDDGHYLFNCRYTNTVYKISKDDGSILWRFGGFQSDFDMNNVTFQRQHDIRFRGSNRTHTLISLLDNAKKGDSDPSYSRALFFALNTQDMTSTLEAHYDHPEEGYARGRGSVQPLDNGNVLVGWSDRSLQSEHAPDGTILMKAVMLPPYTGSYRNYKLPYVGRPLTKPDVDATTHYKKPKDDKDKDRENGEIERSTRVFVSWNGDTEVREWKLFKTSADGRNSREVASKRRRGFETDFELPEVLSYVQLEGYDGDGKKIIESNVVKTMSHPDDLVMTPKDDEAGYAVGYGYRQDKADEKKELEQEKANAACKPPKEDRSGGYFIPTPLLILLVIGCFFGMVQSARNGFAWLRRWQMKRLSRQRYSALATDEEEEKFRSTSDLHGSSLALAPR